MLFRKIIISLISKSEPFGYLEIEPGKILEVEIKFFVEFQRLLKVENYDFIVSETDENRCL